MLELHPQNFGDNPSNDFPEWGIVLNGCTLVQDRVWRSLALLSEFHLITNRFERSLTPKVRLGQH